MTVEERRQRIEDRDQIRETIARYAHGLDLPDREVFASVWTEDAVYDQVNYMVPWLEPHGGLSEETRMYVDPAVIERLMAAQASRA